MTLLEAVSGFGKWLLETFGIVFAVAFICMVSVVAYSMAVSDFKSVEQAIKKPSIASMDIEIVDGMVLLRDGSRTITIQTSNSGFEPDALDMPIEDLRDELFATREMECDVKIAAQTRD